MKLPMVKVQKIDSLIHSISEAEFKDWSITEKYTHLKVVDKDGDTFEITFTPNSKRRGN